MEPVAVGLPFPPLTDTPTVNACAVVMLDEDGVTATVGVDLFPAAVAVPISVMVWLAPATLSELSVNVREPEIAPAVVGAKLIWYVQEPPGISSAPVDDVKRSGQVLAVPFVVPIVNPAEMDGLVPVPGIVKVSGYVPTL
jgi:hypothetical protein